MKGTETLAVTQIGALCRLQAVAIRWSLLPIGMLVMGFLAAVFVPGIRNIPITDNPFIFAYFIGIEIFSLAVVIPLVVVTFKMRSLTLAMSAEELRESLSLADLPKEFKEAMQRRLEALGSELR